MERASRSHSRSPSPARRDETLTSWISPNSSININKENTATRKQAAQVLQEPTRHHPDQDCVLVLVIGEPNAEAFERIRDCELEAVSNKLDVGVLVVRDHTEAAHTLVSDTVFEAHLHHPDHRVHVKVLRCGDTENRRVDVTRLPLAECEVGELKNSCPLREEPRPMSDMGPDLSLLRRDRFTDGLAVLVVQSGPPTLNIPPSALGLPKKLMENFW